MSQNRLIFHLICRMDITTSFSVWCKGDRAEGLDIKTISKVAVSFVSLTCSFLFAIVVVSAL